MNKPFLTFLVFSANGDAAALAKVGRRRAAELGLPADIIHAARPASAATDRRESITALVPAEFAVAEHEAWCLLCQLSLMRAEVTFNILVLGSAGCAAFEARQADLLASTTRPKAVRPRALLSRVA